ncbi:alpha/beta fold hydrolase [Streptomyces johnsoniae]|uniref:Alpha/beta fold hydrolase n=1 Tax=Streptomyces johnsoniae TaxID=3075532 RepID=A0ABU2SA75_9ACTN|nr:alpha/beta fold hydrolase [Streptomyces sp. DSM 41886]MDT0445339.1 alpha/beta fold hydrolase [Streptomyces sp. DSM 41886]
MTTTQAMNPSPARGRPARRRRLVAGITGLASVWGCLIASSPAVAVEEARPRIDWQECPVYSDEVLLARGITENRLPEARAVLERLECGEIDVPLDYEDPHGEQVSVAVTRLPAENQERRLGSLAVNPGGPGGSGFLMPFDLVMRNEASARLDDRYDLIGFDPRGVGYSTTPDCGRPGRGPAAPGPLTETAAREMYDDAAAWNQACGQTDPDFVGALTTENIARDLDRVRRALGERKLSFFGVSWGTRLGVVYRGLFPRGVDRMFLDSVVLPGITWDETSEARAAATERNFARFAEWLAARNAGYGLGTTADEVAATVQDLVRSYDQAPHLYTDIGVYGDGALVARMATRDSREWDRAGQALAELLSTVGAPDGPAPPAVRELAGAGGRAPQVPPGAPEPFNSATQQAIGCNGDPERPAFEETWAAYQERLAENPVTGRSGIFSAGCAGWPLPAQEGELNASRGSLVLSGHRWETAAPYEWTPMTRALVGGRVYTVGDDVHGSALRTEDCAEDVVGYFETGRIDRGCTGSPVP